MPYSSPIPELVKNRFSCRTYDERPIAPDTRRALEDYISSLGAGPFGSKARFKLAAAKDRDRKALRGLGTYGFIHGATGFIIGAISESDHNLEDFGYQMECIILRATDLGLGTCWLGGTFTKSRFAKRISVTRGESVPAVTAVGYEADRRAALDPVARKTAGSDRRLPWDRLFFHTEFGVRLTKEAAGPYAVPLEMVRLGPSASNKQPWRILKAGQIWHFYLQRTPGYRGGAAMRLMRIADMQRIDMGIAMSHFELAASELGLSGRWVLREPVIEKPDSFFEYTATWVAD
jgi:hypothetical protein